MKKKFQAIIAKETEKEDKLKELNGLMTIEAFSFLFSRVMLCLTCLLIIFAFLAQIGNPVVLAFAFIIEIILAASKTKSHDQIVAAYSAFVENYQ